MVVTSVLKKFDFRNHLWLWVGNIFHGIGSERRRRKTNVRYIRYTPTPTTHLPLSLFARVISDDLGDIWAKNVLQAVRQGFAKIVTFYFLEQISIQVPNINIFFFLRHLFPWTLKEKILGIHSTILSKWNTKFSDLSFSSVYLHSLLAPSKG